MAKLFLPVGIPGCGKSSLAQIFFARGARIVSTDAVRERLVSEGKLKDVNDMSANDEVFAQYHNDIELHLARGDSVYADATNLRDYARKQLREIADWLGDVKIHVVVFNNLHEAIKRNQNRDRVVPVDVINRMLEHFEVALRDIPQEGYTSVTYIEGMD